MFAAAGVGWTVWRGRTPHGPPSDLRPLSVRLQDEARRVLLAQGVSDAQVRGMVNRERRAGGVVWIESEWRIDPPEEWSSAAFSKALETAAKAESLRVAGAGRRGSVSVSSGGMTFLRLVPSGQGASARWMPWLDTGLLWWRGAADFARTWMRRLDRLSSERGV